MKSNWWSGIAAAKSVISISLAPPVVPGVRSSPIVRVGSESAPARKPSASVRGKDQPVTVRGIFSHDVGEYAAENTGRRGVLFRILFNGLEDGGGIGMPDGQCEKFRRSLRCVVVNKAFATRIFPALPEQFRCAADFLEVVVAGEVNQYGACRQLGAGLRDGAFGTGGCERQAQQQKSVRCGVPEEPVQI